MKIEVDNVRGFQDILPPKSLKMNKVKEIIERYFRNYGFVPIETPAIEFDELMRTENLHGEQEDGAVSDRFRLKDRAGRNLGLRYEFTFQLARIFKQNTNIKLPFRRYQIGLLFRDEPVGPGRFRQFTQSDADIIGDSSINAEAECLSLVSDILKELKIKAEIYVNNKKLLSALIESVEIKEVNSVIRELDKLDKIGEDNVKMNLRKYADSTKILTLFRLLNKDINFFAENLFDGANELQKLDEECRNYGIKIKFSPMMIRGLSYYTGNIFEVRQEGGESIAGGGRYDKIVGKYIGKDIPSVGISLGLERITELASISIKTIPKVIVISISQKEESLKLTRRLRKEDISVLVSFETPGKALEYADSLHIPYSIFIGEDEIKKKKYKLRDMQSGEEKELSEKQVVFLLKNK